ncbi:hypothetical protein [Lentzea sp. NPDC055074]
MTWFWGSLLVLGTWAVWRRNWWALGLVAVLSGVTLLDDEFRWLSPMHVGAAAVAVALIAVAPRPVWVALLATACAAMAVHTAVVAVPFSEYDKLCNVPGQCVQITITTTTPRFLTQENPATTPLEPWFDLPFLPAWLLVAGLLGWAVRRLSWRVAVAAACYGAALVWLGGHMAPLVVFAAAAAAIGPRKDAHYLAGAGILALALADRYDAWTLLVTLISIVAALGLGIWALVKKNGANAAIALVALAVAPLTPFLGAGVLLVSPVIRRTAGRSAGTPGLQPAE